MLTLKLTRDVINTLQDALDRAETDIESGTQYGDYTLAERDEAIKNINAARAALETVSADDAVATMPQDADGGKVYHMTAQRALTLGIDFKAADDDAARLKAMEVYGALQMSPDAFDDGAVSYDMALDDDAGRTLIHWEK